MTDLFSALPWIVVLLMFVCLVMLLRQAYSIIGELSKLLVQLIAQFSLRAGDQSLPSVLAGTIAALPKPSLAPLAAPTTAVMDPGLVSAVKKFEGFSAKAYGDYKQYSIGYGTKASSATEVITEAEAEKRLEAELAIAAHSVDQFAPNAPVGVKQGLTDLTYNVGPIWQQQALGTLIKAGSYEEAKSHIVQYNHAGGQVLEALTRRREAEVSWFDHPL